MSFSIPLIQDIPYALSDGKEIIIEGRMRPDIDTRFAINFCDPSLENYVLHFNPRIEEGVVVRNHHKSGWGKEEREGGFPFDREQPFQVKILVRGDHFLTYVNNKRFCKFDFRIPLDIAKVLHVAGGVELSRIDFVDGISPSMIKPDTPCTLPLPEGGLHPGLVIWIVGTPIPGLDRFNVNLMSGPDGTDPEISLTFDARFAFGKCKHTVVMNSLIHGEWGKEEREPDAFPFAEGQAFDLKLFVESGFFRIQVNDKDFVRFNHRLLPLSKTKYICIKGRVTIDSVNLY